MEDKEVEFYLFGEKTGHIGVGIRTAGTAIDHDKPGWICPFMGMVVYKVTDEQFTALWAREDLTWLNVHDTYDPFVTTAGVLREIGIDLGKWEFGFFGDVTPDDDRKMLILPTDSNHLIWLHHNVE